MSGTAFTSMHLDYHEQQEADHNIASYEYYNTGLLGHDHVVNHITEEASNNMAEDFGDVQKLAAMLAMGEGCVSGVIAAAENHNAAHAHGLCGTPIRDAELLTTVTRRAMPFQVCDLDNRNAADEINAEYEANFINMQYEDD